MTDYPLAHAEHVAVVAEHGTLRRKIIVTNRRPDSLEFIGSYRHP